MKPQWDNTIYLSNCWKEKGRIYQELVRIGMNENLIGWWIKWKCVHSNLKNHFSVFVNAELMHKLWPGNFILRSRSTWNMNLLLRMKFTRKRHFLGSKMLMAVFFIIDPNQKQQQYLSTIELMKNIAGLDKRIWDSNKNEQCIHISNNVETSCKQYWVKEAIY